MKHTNNCATRMQGLLYQSMLKAYQSTNILEIHSKKGTERLASHPLGRRTPMMIFRIRK